MGRIVNIERSKDNKVRCAEVRLATGHVIRRPVNLLFPLETMEIDGSMSNDLNNNDKNIPKQRPSREPARKARQAIKNQCEYFGAM